MISFITYDKNGELRELYSKVVKKFFYTSIDRYKIYEYDRINQETLNEIEHIEGVRIYILNLDTPGYDASKFARKIRSDGDLISPIILLTKRDKSEVVEELNNVLYLDLLQIDERLIFTLAGALRDAYDIVSRYSVYSFSIFDEIYRLPYNDIYMIKKNFKDDSVTIYTKDDTYTDYITIRGIESELASDLRFLKIHRSVIINLYKVIGYDKKSNTLSFCNGMTTNMISRHGKSILTTRLKNFGRSDYIKSKVDSE